jgi:hypothetical protein
MGGHYRAIDRIRFLCKVLNSPKTVVAFIRHPQSFPLDLLSSRYLEDENDNDPVFLTLCSKRTDLHSDVVVPLSRWVAERATAARKKRARSVKTVSVTNITSFLRCQLGHTNQPFNIFAEQKVREIAHLRRRRVRQHQPQRQPLLQTQSSSRSLRRLEAMRQA